MDKWKSKLEKHLLKDTHPAGRVPFLEIFGPWHCNDFLVYDIDQSIPSHSYDDNNQNWGKFVIHNFLHEPKKTLYLSLAYRVSLTTVPLAYIIKMTRDMGPKVRYRVSDHIEMYMNLVDLRKSHTDLCPNML